MSANVRSAEGEPWWPDFVRDYGEVPLRELARRYETNPRRLRRAAQRAGLTREPEALQGVLDRLGKAPDAALAAEAGVTVEAIAGARRRRDIAGYVREAPAETPAEPNRVRSAPPKRSARVPAVATAEAVVVVRRSSGSRDYEPSPSRRPPRLPSTPAMPEVVERRPRRRRRIVVQDARPEIDPPPEPPPSRRRTRRESPHSEVRVITPEPVVAAPEPPRAEVPEPAPAVTPEPAPAVAPEPPPAIVSAPAPVVAPVDAPAPAPADEPLVDVRLWWARVLADGEEQEVVVEASDLSSAAALAKTKGEVLRLELAQQL